LLAIVVWNVTMASRAVSTSCASIAGAVTRSSGSYPNTGVPSGTAHTSPVKRSCGRVSSKKRGATVRRFGRWRSHAICSGVNRSVSRYWSACSRPAATR